MKINIKTALFCYITSVFFIHHWPLYKLKLINYKIKIKKNVCILHSHVDFLIENHIGHSVFNINIMIYNDNCITKSLYINLTKAVNISLFKLIIYEDY